MNLATRIKDLRDLVELQGRHGNWDHDDYMCGLFNGMEISLAMLETREPQFRALPKERVSAIRAETLKAAADRLLEKLGIDDEGYIIHKCKRIASSSLRAAIMEEPK